MRRPPLFATLAVVLTLVIGWVLLFALPRWYGPREPRPAAGASPAQPEAARKITATLFYISEDGSRLTTAKREVAFAASTAEQARRIIETALLPAPAPHATAIPQGTKLRALFLTGRGEAYVDFTREIAAAHGGGSLNELFTVYAIVNALTVNLPAVTAVQILVDGKEVDTLAGHVDLRRPLGRNLKWTEQ